MITNYPFGSKVAASKTERWASPRTLSKKSTFFAAAVALSFTSFCSASESPSPDKSTYSAFNRTPESQLRELSTDRPDLTESPYSVDAGWWQLEMDVVAFTRDHDKSDGNNLTGNALSVANINLKFGLTAKIDLQTGVESYNRVKVKANASGLEEHSSGFGDITSRLKINLWGNDGGRSAFALMPFIKWPTNQNGLGNKSVEGGLILPYAHDLPGGWGMGLMTEFDIVRNDADAGYNVNWLNTITVSHDLTEKLGFYLELTNLTTRGPTLATFDCGLTYGFSKQIQLDLGANIALTAAADDLTVFAGLSMRF